MAIAVASVGTAEYKLGSTSNFTVDFVKPSGLAVGDLMVGCFYTDAGTVPITSLTRTGWTAFSVGVAVETSGLFMLYKIADSADAAASTFTFTTNYSGSGGGKVGGAILRVTGFGAGTTPVSIYDTDENRNSASASFNSFVGTFTPADTESLLVFIIAGANNETAAGAFSSYSISGTNPTWTEQFDIFDADGDDSVIAVATAIDSTTTTRTTASATCSVAQDDYLLILSSFQAAKDASGTNALLEVQPTIFNNAGVEVGGTGTNALLEVSPNIPTQSGDSTVPTVWTTIDKT